MDHTPELPSHLKPKTSKCEVDASEEYGLILPPHLQRTHLNTSNDEDLFCPQLPPHLQKSVQTACDEVFYPELSLDARKDTKKTINSHSQSNQQMNRNKETAQKSHRCKFSKHKEKSTNEKESDHSCSILHQQNSKNLMVDYTDDSYCPQLPPHLQKNNTFESNEDLFCPQLPPHLQKHPTPSNRSKKGVEYEAFTCELPPHLQKTKKSETIKGPTLPEDYKEQLQASSYSSDSSDSADDCVVGPMPSAKSVDMDEYHINIVENRLNKCNEKTPEVSELIFSK